MAWFLLPCLFGKRQCSACPEVPKVAFPGDPAFLAAASGVRAALILLPGTEGVVPSDSCVCHCVGLGVFASALVWFGSVPETRFVTKQEGAGM